MPSSLPDNADHDAIARLRRQRAAWLKRPSASPWRAACERTAHLRALSHDFSGPVVRIGSAADITPADKASLLGSLRAFMPWRKGPFDIFGIPVDAEWRSDRKWQRLEPVLPDLRGKTIADIGCNNGYYMFRMAHHAPALVIGLEPCVRFYYTFQCLNTFAGRDNLRFELLGVEHIALFPNCFDLIFLMGILYHHPNPLHMLRDIRSALKPGGMVIVENQAIPGDEPVALFPAKRYAKVPGTYFVPTAACLVNWMQRAGLRDVDLFCSHAMSSREQRRTEWMPYESYTDYLDPKDPTRTVEGYPAPLRVYAKALR